MCAKTREYPHNIPSGNRRFKKGVWQKPTAKGRGWTASVGLAGLTYEEGLEKIARLNSLGRNIVDATPATNEFPVAPVDVNGPPTDTMHRRFNVALGVWQKPTRTLDGWQESGLGSRYSLEDGTAFLAQAVENGHGYINIGPTSEPVAVVPDEQTVDATAFDNFLNDGPIPNVRAGEGPFGVEFMPVLTVLPNGAITLTADASVTISLARAVMSVVKNNLGSTDATLLAPLAATLIRDESRLYNDAMATLRETPFGA